ncbi:MAG: putative lipid II flippase FtsW [Candidatus Sumerlaeaceae bacterium]
MRLNTTWMIYLCTLMLMTTGIVMVYSSSAAIAARETMRKATEPGRDLKDTEAIIQTSTHSSYYLQRQVIFAAIGVLVMLLMYQIDYERYKKYATPLLFLSLVMLVLVFFPPIGVARKGAHRWLNAGFMLVQSSEFAKLAMILYMAKKLCDRQSDLKSFARGFLPSLAVLALFLGLIVSEPDLGAAVMLGVIVFAMWYVSGMRLIHLCSLGIAAIPVVAYEIISKPYRLKRIIAFWDPIANRETSGWQLVQSLISVSTGGVEGLGLGQGPQKYQFLSEGHTDFIYAGICEEMGMAGALVIFAIYAFFMFQGIRVASRAPDMYGSLLATGVTIMIGVQSFVNMYVVLGLLPTKGLTLPLISYGGSSLVINCAAIGILMNVSRFTEIAANPSRARGSDLPK